MSPAFTEVESCFLKELLAANAASLNDRSLCKPAVERKARTWYEIAEMYNGIPTHAVKTLPQLKKFFDNVKQEQKKKGAERKRNLMKTGGGPHEPHRQEPTLLGDVCMDPFAIEFHNVPDSDGARLAMNGNNGEYLIMDGVFIPKEQEKGFNASSETPTRPIRY